jgi:hypothetical protein
MQKSAFATACFCIRERGFLQFRMCWQVTPQEAPHYLRVFPPPPAFPRQPGDGRIILEGPHQSQSDRYSDQGTRAFHLEQVLQVGDVGVHGPRPQPDAAPNLVVRLAQRQTPKDLVVTRSDRWAFESPQQDVEVRAGRIDLAARHALQAAKDALLERVVGR